MSRPLPADREKALEAVANGWGREATAAHPLCRCGKPYLPGCGYCGAEVGQPCRGPGETEMPPGTKHRTRVERIGKPSDCPVHGGTE